MKTPGEIKKGLERCSSETMFCAPEDPRCSYDCDDVVCIYDLMRDALAYIQQLEAERDAAVETIYEMAECITEDVCEWCDGVECERLCMPHTILRPGFKWRGVQKEDSDA